MMIAEIGDVVRWVVLTACLGIVFGVTFFLMRKKFAGESPKPAAEDKKPEESDKESGPTPEQPKEQPKEPPKPEAPKAEEPKAEPVPEPTPEPPAEEPKPDREPAKPATLEVEALSPSMTDAMPALDAEADEMRMGTDEMPKFGTAEMPALDETGGPATYRTSAAQELSAAIESGECPKCKAPTFVGAETPQEVGADGTAMFKLDARCGACGHKANLIDMKVG